ncbi:MAG: hypothetical protein JNJ83_03075 [Verrucomicrobiaceae bacterium]|nr:hypothetical protein [Verrucomicrobiaceae bacterium]
MVEVLPFPAALQSPFSTSVRLVHSFDELLSTPFQADVNALCWQRKLDGDFSELLQHIESDTDIVILDEAPFQRMPLSAAGKIASQAMLADFTRLLNAGLQPTIECVNGYQRDDPDSPVQTDVFSFHVDSATTETDTWLCTYHGPCSEALLNTDAIPRIHVPETRARLLADYGGEDDADFVEWLADNCFDLHYVPRTGAKAYSFGLGNLWRISTQHPGAKVPPCVHRAPPTSPGERRLLLIS